jgi:hypothetical protein
MKFVLFFLSVALLAGCGDGRPKRVPISGQVLIDGKPLDFGFIQFMPENARASDCNLDSNGRFTLSCFGQNDGAVPGKHIVVVSAGETLSPTKTRWHAPKKYADYRTSGLTQEITDANENLTINITWDGGQPYTEVNDSGEEKSVRPGTRGFN